VRHSVLDTESSVIKPFWIPAFAGMTVFELFTSLSPVKENACFRRLFNLKTGG
jgi:hypothetical protein